MTGTPVLIAGTDKSIGFETARPLGRLGERIWLGFRDLERSQAAVESLAAEGDDARPPVTDITGDDSGRATAARVQDEDGRLARLIDNACMPGRQKAMTSQQPVSDIRDVHETNVFDPIAITQAVLPLLQSAGHANAVMVGDGLASLGWLSDPANQFYGVSNSKSAPNAVTMAFAKELAAFGVKVNAADPGYTATDFNGHAGYRTVEQAAAGIVWLANQDASGPTEDFCSEPGRFRGDHGRGCRQSPPIGCSRITK